MSEAGEKNKALVRRLYDAQTRGDLEAMRELLAPDFVVGFTFENTILQVKQGG